MTPIQVSNLQNLRPAVRCGKDVRVGAMGQTHAQIPRKPGTAEAGFVDIREGHFLSRSQAAERIGVQGLESLDSQTLSRLQKVYPNTGSVEP